MVCGHFNFIVRDNWLLCQDCPHGIRADSPQGKRRIERRQGLHQLDPQQLATFRALQESYQELIKETTKTVAFKGDK
jgi:hypothetical protein